MILGPGSRLQLRYKTRLLRCCGILSSLKRSTASITASFARFRSAGRIQSNAPEAGTYFFFARCDSWCRFRHCNHRIGLLISTCHRNAGFARGFDLPAANSDYAARLDLRLSPHGPATEVAGHTNGNDRVDPNHHDIRCRFVCYGPVRTGAAGSQSTAERQPVINLIGSVSAER